MNSHGRLDEDVEAGTRMTQELSPECPQCGAAMVLKTARRGRNAGGQFWGCTKYPECKGTLDVGSPSEDVEAEPTAMTNRAVPWTDGTARREGWRTRFETVGASLRSISVDGDAGLLSSAWIAREDVPSYEPADADTRRVVGMMAKLLHRGAAPPLHPDSERWLLEGLGLGAEIVPSLAPGDIAPRLRRQRRLTAAGVRLSSEQLDLPEGLLESSAEEGFVRWLSREHPELVGWLAPQVP